MISPETPGYSDWIHVTAFLQSSKSLSGILPVSEQICPASDKLNSYKYKTNTSIASNSTYEKHYSLIDDKEVIVLLT